MFLPHSLSKISINDLVSGEYDYKIILSVSLGIVTSDLKKKKNCRLGSQVRQQQFSCDWWRQKMLAQWLKVRFTQTSLIPVCIKHHRKGKFLRVEPRIPWAAIKFLTHLSMLTSSALSSFSLNPGQQLRGSSLSAEFKRRTQSLISGQLEPKSIYV